MSFFAHQKCRLQIKHYLQILASTALIQTSLHRAESYIILALKQILLQLPQIVIILLQAFLIIVDPVGGTKEQRDVDPKLQYPFSFRGFLTSVRFRSNGTYEDLSNRGTFEIHIIARNGEIVSSQWLLAGIVCLLFE